jgi:hypothetical protein
MQSEWKQQSTAGAGGRIEVVVPGLKPGAIVEVAVRFEDETQRPQRPLGLLRGKIHIAENFDEALDDFASYT